ncbi:hypothetical protein WDW86_05725 [Bdellovibrionota bacterium FG-2]
MRLEDIKGKAKSKEPAMIRKVGFGLGLGILFFPYVFSWFTLKPGYDPVIRLISIGWLEILTVLLVLNQLPQKHVDANVNSQIAEQAAKIRSPAEEAGPKNSELSHPKYTPNETENQRKWYQGGTLQYVKMKKWVDAPYRNRLATSADWIAAVLKEIDKEKAVALEACVSEVGKRKNAHFLKTQTSADVAVTCTFRLGYVTKESNE